MTETLSHSHKDDNKSHGLLKLYMITILEKPCLKVITTATEVMAF